MVASLELVGGAAKAAATMRKKTNAFNIQKKIKTKYSNENTSLKLQARTVFILKSVLYCLWLCVEESYLQKMIPALLYQTITPTPHHQGICQWWGGFCVGEQWWVLTLPHSPSDHRAIRVCPKRCVFSLTNGTLSKLHSRKSVRILESSRRVAGRSSLLCPICFKFAFVGRSIRSRWKSACLCNFRNSVTDFAIVTYRLVGLGSVSLKLF